ncbi:MAG: hypothetical protein IJ370_08620 [Oscillospiraceae bacterium]|nr:hypothetical protein [Oscillospiraceae bacterium]
MFVREQRSYTIKTVDENFSWNDIEKAPIDIFCWTYNYKPKTFAQLVFIEGKEIRAKLTCYETDPETRCDTFGQDVWKDSCLEFFAAFNPETPDIYVNCEMNSAGAALMALGNNDVENRVSADKILGHIPYFAGEVFEDHWCAEVRLTVEDIKTLFGVEIKRGFKFKGNFFKCGDETKFEHYGMWCRSVAVIPQFHRPQYFGDLVID